MGRFIPDFLLKTRYYIIVHEDGSGSHLFSSGEICEITIHFQRGPDEKQAHRERCYVGDYNGRSGWSLLHPALPPHPPLSHTLTHSALPHFFAWLFLLISLADCAASYVGNFDLYIESFCKKKTSLKYFWKIKIEFISYKKVTNMFKKQLTNG